MSNINRDYTIVLDVKSGTFTAPTMYFYNTDINTSNIYVQLGIKETLLNVNPIDNATDYKIKVNIIKPNKVVKVIYGVLVNEEESIFEFDLPEDCTNISGIYKLEFEVSCIVSERPENITTFPSKYEVKKSILTDFVPEITDTEDNTMMRDILTQLQSKFDDVRLNTDDTTGTHIVLDFYANSVKVDSIVFDIEGGLGGATTIPDEYITETELEAELDNYSLATHTHDTYASKEDLDKIINLVDKPPTYVKPSLNLSASVSNLQHNIATNITLNPSFSRNDGGDITKYVLNKGNTKLYENTSLGSYTDTVTLPYNSSVTYTASVTYADGTIKNTSLGIPYPSTSIKAGTVTTSKTIKCYALSYTGITSNSTITVADISSLTSRLCTSKSYTGTYNLDNQRVVYMYPSYLGVLTSIKDSNNFDYINSYTLTKMTYNDVEYNIYILTDPVTITGFKQIFN